MGFIRVLTRVMNGLTANDGTGDSLRAGAASINDSWDAIEQAVNGLAASQGSGTKPYALKSDMLADASVPNGTIAFVFADPTAGNNGSYVKQAGAWILAYDKLGLAIGNPGGFLQQGAGASIRTVNDKAGESFSMLDFKPGNTDTQAMQAAANALAALYATGEVLVPAGNYSIATVNLPDGIGIRAVGKVTITSASGTNMFVMGNRSFILGAKLVGSGMGTSDIGIYALNKDSLLVQGCTFAGFRKAPVKLDNCTNSGITRSIFSGNYGSDSGVVTSSIEPDIYFNGSCSNGYATDNIHIADASRPKQAAVFISTFDPTKRWSNMVVSRNFITNYARGGIYPDDENPTGGVDSAYATISNNIIVNSGQEAIKVKNCQFMVITNNVINGFETISVEAAGNLLQGGIFVNNGAGSIVSGNVVIGSGAACTDGIHISGTSDDTVWTYANTFPRWGVTVANNTIRNCGKFAVRADQVSQLAVTGNVALDCAGFMGCIWDPLHPTRINNNVTVTGNTYRGGTFGGGSNYGAWFYNVKNLVYGHNMLVDCANTGLFLQSCTDAKVTSSFVFNACRVAGGAFGVQITDCTNLSLSGVTSSGRDGITTQQYGLRLTGTNSGLSVFDCDLSGNAVGAVTGLAFPSDSFVRDVKGYLAGTQPWTPAALANGASTKQGISVPGAIVGDYAEVSAPGTLAGLIATAYVKANDACDIVLLNPTGASVTPPSGTWKVRVTKRPTN